MKTSPKLQPVESPEQWANGLDAFRKRYGLSFRELAGVCSSGGSFISKTSIIRLINGQSEPRFIDRIRGGVLEGIRNFLVDRKKPETDIEIELRTIFCKEEIPVITKRAVLTQAAQKFFGLRLDPFTGDPRNRSDVFTTPQLDRLAAQVEDAINYQGFVAVIGDIGSGKSLLKRRTIHTCNDSAGKMKVLWPQFFNMEKVHSGAIASYVLHEFDHRAAMNLVDRHSSLEKLLANLAEDGVHVALGFDECHRLDPSLLTALKNFWEIGSGGYDRYLGLVLFGQPRFETTLRLPEFREITERLDLIHMPNLGRNAWDYVSHRVKTAGGNAEKIFDREAVADMSRIASTPLALGNLANNSLLKAFETGDKRVTRALVSSLYGSTNGDPRLRSIR